MKSLAYKEMHKRLTAAAKAKRIPVIGHYELTSRCNLDCKMCYIHNQDHAAALQKELSTEQWKRIFDEACACEMTFATLTGGECLIRKDFKELYLHLWNKNVMVSVMTNGTLLNDDYVDFFKTYTPDCVRISLYGSSEDGYLQLTGHKGFERATKAIDALMQAGIEVIVTATPSRYMTDDYINIVKLCRDRGYNLEMTDITLISNRENPEKDDYFLSEDETFDLMKRRAEVFCALTPLECVPEIGGSMTSDPQTGLNCGAGNCLVTVTFDGKMYPCGNAMVGEGASLLEMSYADAWEKTKSAIDTLVQAAECVGCSYNMACPACIPYRLKDFHCGHCNPAVCSLTKRLVAAGIKPLVPAK